MANILTGGDKTGQGGDSGMRKRLARLSRQDILNVAELSYEAAKADSIEGATRVFRSMYALLPVRGAICVQARWDASGETCEARQILNFGYPPEWIALYGERRFDRVDPVLRGYRSGADVQAWSQAFRAARSPDERAFMEVCEAFGLREGVTVGLGGAGGYHSILAFWGKDLAQTARHRTIIEFVAPSWHGLLGRLSGSPAGEGPAQAARGLTPREAQMLYWVGFGKTTWEIARIVGITDRTVQFHLGNAMQKLNARNRAQAVAKAAALGMLRRPP